MAAAGHAGTDEVLDGVDLTGRTVLVTGASSGLGVETARALAAHGARLVLGVRDPGAATAVLAEAGVDLGAGHAVLPLDLADLASVRACADAVAERVDRLDVLIANAGIMATPPGTTADGFELQLGTNHLGHFVLVGRLAPLLVRSAPARVVVLSSGGHRIAGVDLDDPWFERTPYDPWVAYGRSKTANVLFAVELDRRLADRGVRATAVHPGAIVTGLGRHLTAETLQQMQDRAGGRRMEFKPVEQGAATTVWAAAVADADVVGGRYCEDLGVAEVTTDAVAPAGVLPHAVDPEQARALWTWSEEQVSETFAF
jgi:NAD(P)-dependent dehydrogenase (short-subunit alcohol dehydrogenase family)